MHFKSGINLRQPFSKNCYLTFIDLTIRSILDNELGMQPIQLTLEKEKTNIFFGRLFYLFNGYNFLILRHSQFGSSSSIFYACW